MQQEVFDVEVFPNLFTAVFIDVDTPKKFIEAYCKADYLGLTDIKRDILNNYIKPKIFVISKNISNLDLLAKHLSYHKTLIGYNSLHYDNKILDYIIQQASYVGNKFNRGYNRNTDNHITKDLYELSKTIIEYGEIDETTFGYDKFKPPRYYKKPYFSKDLMRLLYLDKLRVSLKQVAVQLKWYRLEDLPLSPYEEVDEGDIHKIIDYNINDVLITYMLYHNQIDEVKLRESTSKFYNVNAYTESRSGTANKLMMKFYAERSGLDVKEFIDERTYRSTIHYDSIISSKIEFKSQHLQQFLRFLKSKILMVEAEKLSESVQFQNKVYNFGTGGLHSKDEPRIYESDDENLIVDADVGSFYPRIILNEKVFPRHLDGEIFLSILDMVTESRLEAKKLTKIFETNKEVSEEDYARLHPVYKVKADALKIVINAIYGKLGDEHSFLYDLKAMYKVTINGQLYLLMLIDMLAEIGIECISANTDGIICKVPRNRYDKYLQACKEWEKKTDFNLEYTSYEKYVCYAVNDYMAIKEGYKDTNRTDEDKSKFIKEKGLFVTNTQIDKGYDKPIVAKGLKLHFADNIPIEDTIRNCKDIYDFCISVKVGSQFLKEYHIIRNKKYVVEELQKNIRYYITNSGGSIIKRYKTPKIDKRGQKREYIKLHKGVVSTIFNDYVHHKDMEKYDINYGYYISQTKNILYDVLNVNVNKQKNRSYGGLFDQDFTN